MIRLPALFSSVPQVCVWLGWALFEWEPPKTSGLIRSVRSQNTPLVSWLSRPNSPSEQPAHQTPAPDPGPWAHFSPDSPTEHKVEPQYNNNNNHHCHHLNSWGMNDYMFLSNQHFQRTGGTAIFHPPAEDFVFFAITQKLYCYAEAATVRLLRREKNCVNKRCQNKPSNKGKLGEKTTWKLKDQLERQPMDEHKAHHDYLLV